jgi:hypothetical protein
VIRRLALILAVAWLLSGCSSDCNSATCRGGITFNVAEVVGALARGTEEPLHVCFDGTCHDVTVSRTKTKSTVFLPFDGVGNDVDHQLTVTGTGAFKGDYTGKIASYIQKPNGPKCGGSCALASVKIAANGALTPGVPAAPRTQASIPTSSAAPATVAGVTPATKP